MRNSIFITTLSGESTLYWWKKITKISYLGCDLKKNCEQVKITWAAQLVSEYFQDLKALQQLHKAKTTVSHDDHHSNIATVLLGDQKSQDEELGGETTEANVLKALEQKYDAIRDKLLIEVNTGLWLLVMPADLIWESNFPSVCSCVCPSTPNLVSSGPPLSSQVHYSNP